MSTFPASTGTGDIDLEFLRTWIGKETIDDDVLSSRHARLMAATLGLAQDAFVDGAELPPLWHWLYFLEGLPAGELGRDGHPARGGFLPPVPLPNRMWAGGRLEFRAPLALGSRVRKRSAVRSVEHKRGRSGNLVFVTVRHEILDGDRVAITEDQDLVYKQPGLPGAAPSPSTASAAGLQASHSELFEATSTLLFRYSALTFNGHRIHYDQDYCRKVEGYANLVIHGPLQATLLAGMAARLGAGPLRHFRYRALRPSLLGTALTVNAAVMADGLSLWTAQPDGSVSMQAEATF
ncbi:MAG TPA: MaoC family dehydratase N-terminal domain-containing protein [Rubrivivax sp.]|nr:MaoC family dehydratase N-terminal domain-containing protein [Rubrivivax sp.]